MLRFCWCGQHQLEPEEATYVINGRPAHDANCYSLGLEKAGMAEGVEDPRVVGFNKDTGTLIRIHAPRNGVLGRRLGNPNWGV